MFVLVVSPGFSLVQTMMTDRQQHCDEPSCRGLPLGWPNNIIFSAFFRMLEAMQYVLYADASQGPLFMLGGDGFLVYEEVSHI